MNWSIILEYMEWQIYITSDIYRAKMSFLTRTPVWTGRSYWNTWNDKYTTSDIYRAKMSFLTRTPVWTGRSYWSTWNDKYTKSDIYIASVLTALTRTPIIFSFEKMHSLLPAVWPIFRAEIVPGNLTKSLIEKVRFFRAEIVPGNLTKSLIEKVRYLFRSPSGDSKKNHREAFVLVSVDTCQKRGEVERGRQLRFLNAYTAVTDMQIIPVDRTDFHLNRATVCVLHVCWTYNRQEVSTGALVSATKDAGT